MTDIDLSGNSILIGSTDIANASRLPGFVITSYQDGVTARAGGGQASGFPVTAAITRVTTVGTAADSLTLPVATPGMQLTIINAAAANSMNVFPNPGGTTTERINLVAANGAFAIAATKVVTFFCTVAGQWHTILTA